MGGGKGKGAIVSETCGHLGGQGENGESSAVQSGRAMPKGRCASPPCNTSDGPNTHNSEGNNQTPTFV